MAHGVHIDLSGKTAIITGASQGLGAATATLLHQAGASVVINYFNDPQGANKAKADALINTLGSRATTFAADVRDASSIDRMFDDATKQFGGVDILVNNAAILADRTIKKMTDDEWRRVIDTNLTGVFNTCRAASTKLNDGGRIVSLASIAGFMGFFGQANYAAAKAGVVAMTKVLSRELARRQITVNAVAPGVVLTDMGQSIPEEVRAKMLEQVPLGRFGESSDIASAILFLCSDLAPYITGQTIHVNGGWYA